MDTKNLSKLWEGWTPPEGLDRSWPRPTALTGSGIMLHVLALLMVTGGVVGAVWLARETRRQDAEAHRMLAEGHRVAGAVTRLWRSGGNSDAYRVAYRFKVGGREYTGHATVGSDFWNRLHVLTAVAVTYLPSNPTHNYLTASPPGTTPAWLPFFVGGISVVIGVVLPLQVRRQRHLLEDGRPAPAVVTRMRKWRTQHGTQNVVYYQFALPGGGVCKGRSNVHRRPLPEGTVICILYDPDNPRRSGVYPLCAVKLAVS